MKRRDRRKTLRIRRGMQFTIRKGRAKGSRGSVVNTHGSDVLVKTNKRVYWTKMTTLTKRVKFGRAK